MNPFRSSFQNFFLFACITLISMGIFGCSRTYPEPEVATEEVLQHFTTPNTQRPETLRIIARVDYVDEMHNKRVAGQEMIVSAGEPQSMRITISAFDKVLSTLVTDGIGFSLLDVSQNLFISGFSTPENIARLLPVYLSAADLYRVITGSYPQDNLSPDTVPSIEWDKKLGGYCRSFPLNDGNIMHVWQTWPDGDIFRITVESKENTEYIYEASDFATYGDAKLRYPKTIIFRLPPQKTDVRLRVEKRDLDVDFSPAVFRLTPPAGARIVMLDMQMVPNPQNTPADSSSDVESTSDADSSSDVESGDM